MARAQSVFDGFDPGANNTVRTIAVQPDGQILVGGDFTMLGGGGTGSTARESIARLNPDGSLDPGVTPVRAVHILELPARIDAVRVSFGLAAFAWTGGAVVAGTTTVQLAHLMELRTALQQAYAAAGLLGPTFTDPAPVPQNTVIYALHITELREKVGDLEQR